MRLVTNMSFLILTACSSLSGVSKTEIDFATLKKLNLSDFDSAKFSQKFGQPTSKLVSSSVQTWEYQAADGRRLMAAYFNGNSLLQSVLLFPSASSQGELKFDDVKHSYPNAKFTVAKDDWIESGGHTDSVTYDAADLGITIMAGHWTNRVDAIAWTVPEQRAPATK